MCRTIGYRWPQCCGRVSWFRTSKCHSRPEAAAQHIKTMFIGRSLEEIELLGKQQSEMDKTSSGQLQDGWPQEKKRKDDCLGGDYYDPIVITLNLTCAWCHQSRVEEYCDEEVRRAQLGYDRVSAAFSSPIAWDVRILSRVEQQELDESKVELDARKQWRDQVLWKTMAFFPTIGKQDRTRHPRVRTAMGKSRLRNELSTEDVQKSSESLDTGWLNANAMGVAHEHLHDDSDGDKKWTLNEVENARWYAELQAQWEDGYSSNCEEMPPELAALLGSEETHTSYTGQVEHGKWNWETAESITIEEEIHSDGSTDVERTIAIVKPSRSDGDLEELTTLSHREQVREFCLQQFVRANTELFPISQYPSGKLPHRNSVAVTNPAPAETSEEPPDAFIATAIESVKSSMPHRPGDPDDEGPPALAIITGTVLTPSSTPTSSLASSPTWTPERSSTSRPHTPATPVTPPSEPTENYSDLVPVPLPVDVTDLPPCESKRKDQASGWWEDIGRRRRGRRATLQRDKAVQ